MMYWNNAALIGGDLDDAFDSFQGMPPVEITEEDLTGGWAFSDGAQQATLQFLGLPEGDQKLNMAQGWLTNNMTPEVQNIIDKITARYDIPDMRILAEVLWYVFAYDSFVANGSTQAAWLLREQLKRDPVAKRIFDYVRRKIHVGPSKAEKLTKAQRDARRNAFYNDVSQRRNFLRAPGTMWVGSNPYTGNAFRTAGLYRGLQVGRWNQRMKDAARASRSRMYGAFMTRKPPKPPKRRTAAAVPVVVPAVAPAAAPAVVPVVAPAAPRLPTSIRRAAPPIKRPAPAIVYPAAA